MHRLVAAAFIGPCPAGNQVNHRDGHKDNNAATNLEYVSQSENVRHGLRNGLYPRKLTDDDVRDIRFLVGWAPVAALAALYGVGPRTIRSIRQGRIYHWVL